MGYGVAGPLIEESLELFRRLGDKEGIMRAQSSAGIVALGQGQEERGMKFLEEATNLALEIGDRWSASLLLGFTTAVPLGRGDIAAARALLGANEWEKAWAEGRELTVGQAAADALEGT